MKYNSRNILSISLVLLFICSVLLIKPIHILHDHHKESSCCSHNKNTPDTENTETHDCSICHFYFDSFSYQEPVIYADAVDVSVRELYIKENSKLIKQLTRLISLRAPPSSSISL